MSTSSLAVEIPQDVLWTFWLILRYQIVHFVLQTSFPTPEAFLSFVFLRFSFHISWISPVLFYCRSKIRGGNFEFPKDPAQHLGLISQIKVIKRTFTSYNKASSQLFFEIGVCFHSWLRSQ